MERGLTSRPAIGHLWVAFLAAVALLIAAADPDAGHARSKAGGLLKYPEAVAVGPQGDVYVGDIDLRKVRKYTPYGDLLRSWEVGQTSGYQEPVSVAIDNEDNVYVGIHDYDAGSSTIEKYSSAGKLIKIWRPVIDYDGAPFLSQDLAKPYSGVFVEAIATDPAGFLYLVGSSGVMKFTLGGKFVGRTGTGWEGEPSDDGYLAEPMGLAVGPAGNAYVADSPVFGEPHVVKFLPDGNFSMQWGSGGSGNGQFSLIGGIATDSAGSVFVSDYVSERVQKFTSSGSFVRSWGGPGSGNGQFSAVSGIATDLSGNVYVADSSNGRIQKFTSNGKFLMKWGDGSPGPRVARPKITFSPRKKTAKRGATFRFIGTWSGLRFQCKLSGRNVPKAKKRWRSCASPKHYRKLKPGKKVFRVRATTRGRVSKAVRYRWTVAKGRRSRSR